MLTDAAFASLCGKDDAGHYRLAPSGDLAWYPGPAPRQDPARTHDAHDVCRGHKLTDRERVWLKQAIAEKLIALNEPTA